MEFSESDFNYRVKKQKRLFLEVIVVMTMLFVVTDIILYVRWRKEKDIENVLLENEQRIENEMLKEELVKHAQIEIDREFHRIDSLVNSLPKPTSGNYSKCVTKVREIHWQTVNVSNVEPLEEYQNESKKNALSMLNAYIAKLHKIEPKYVDWQGNKTNDKDCLLYVTAVGDSVTTPNQESPDYVEFIETYNF